MWYVVMWKGRNGRRGAVYPTSNLTFAQDCRAGLIEPALARVRKFATRDDAFAAYYRALA